MARTGKGRIDKFCVEDPECRLLTPARAPSGCAALLGAQEDPREKAPELPRAQGLWKGQHTFPLSYHHVLTHSSLVRLAG